MTNNTQFKDALENFDMYGVLDYRHTEFSVTTKEVIRLALQTPAQEWNFDLDEAPRDKPFLMWWYDAPKAVFMAKFGEESGILYYYSYVKGDWLISHKKITAWQPLPLPPAPKSEKE